MPLRPAPGAVEAVPRIEVHTAGDIAEVQQVRHEHKTVGVPQVQVRSVPVAQVEEVVLTVKRAHAETVEVRRGAAVPVR